jgi:hypothetical protein
MAKSFNFDPTKDFDKRIEGEIEARLQELDLERTKWTRILGMMRGEPSQAEAELIAVVKSSAPFSYTTPAGPLSFTEVVFEAMRKLKGEDFNLEKVVRVVRTLPFPEAQRMSRQQVRNAFRKIVVRRSSPITLARKGGGNSGDDYRWK